jgi:tRNA dimethylallyltransferase
MPVKKPRRPVIVFIIGPTAIGKTRLSIKLAGRIRGQIISADSMQVYKGMDILSQAPHVSQKKAVRHHLAGVLSPEKEYSAADFRQKAALIIDSLFKRKIRPIVVGGSGLYVKALVDGLFPSPPADPKFRKKMQVFISKYGPRRLHRKLSGIDPEAAAAVHPNDARRVIRALEIHRSTGRTMTELKKDTKGLKDIYRIKIFGLTRPRDGIYSDIESRIDGMFEDGAIDEVKRLRRKNLSKTAKAVLGFKEIAGYLDGKYDLETAKAMMKKNTRHFARRQLSWFRADRRIRWFDVSKMGEEGIIREIKRVYKGR